jgi:cytochrome c553
MAYFRNDTRKAIRMNAIAKTVTPQEDREAAEFFAGLKPTKFTRVVEADMVPETYVTRFRERYVKKGGKMEPLGERIIAVPEDAERVDARDPHSGFVAYVPKGSVKRGEALAKTGGNGKTVQCAICHGEGLRGLGEVPRLANLHPIYVARQLYDMKRGESNGKMAQLMKQVDLTGLFCTSRIERLSTERNRENAEEDIHAGADRGEVAAD